MNRGVPPTARKARTGELTPPGMTFCARANSSAERGASLTRPVSQLCGGRLDSGCPAFLLAGSQPACLDDPGQELPGARLPRVVQHLARWPDLQQPAAVEEAHRVGDLPGEAHLVGGDQ